MKAMMKCALWCGLLFVSTIASAESLSICDVPSRLPRNTGLGTYSPPLCFDYAGLSSGQTYTLKVWLLAPGPWFCASSQWCERQVMLDNTSGTNSAGRLLFVQNMDVYSYGQFDWVLRLYNSNGSEVAFTERFTEATDNRAPVLNPIGSRTIVAGQALEFVVSASDLDGGAVSLSATNLPAGAEFDSLTGRFSWVPDSPGTYSNILFTATDDGEGSLTDAELIQITVRAGPAIVAQPQDQVVQEGATASFSIQATSDEAIGYQWRFNGIDIPNANSAMLQLVGVTTNQAGAYSVRVSDSYGSQVSREAVLTVVVSRTCLESAGLSIEHLRRVMDEFHNRIPVYDDISSPGNRFHARGQLPNQSSLVTISGSWTNNPRSGATCNRCTFARGGDDFGGFYFMNGILLPADAPPPLLPNAPAPYFGEGNVPGSSIPVTNFTGLNLEGATALTFWARGEEGGESIEFFIGGVGRNPVTGIAEVPFPDSTPRHPPIGTAVVLAKEWQKFTIQLAGLNLTNIMGGLGWAANGPRNPNGAIFYLDDIQYELSPEALLRRLNEPRFLRSFLTKGVQPDPNDGNRDDDLDLVLRNTAFTYDNALALEAFLADGSDDSLRRARLLGDAFVYASLHDRSFTDGRIRTAYSAGDIALPPGWEANGRKATTPVPGFYLDQGQSFFEVENRDVDTGNNAWVMLALLALYERDGGAAYLEAARRIASFIQTFRDNQGPYQGYRGGIYFAETSSPTNRPYTSTEHNLDIVAAFTRMFRITGETEWADGARHTGEFVESMWDATIGCYRTGTNEIDPESRNETPGQLPLDTQSWNVLARPESLTLHPDLLAGAEQYHRNAADGFSGFDFNEDKDGVWMEGTAQMAVAYAAANQSAVAEELLGTLKAAQQIPPPFGDGLGTVAASHDGVSSGFGFKLFRRPHVGATSWSVFAHLNFNPYYDSFGGLRMTISRSGSNVLLSWPACYSGAVLEEKSHLSAVSWTPVGTQNPTLIPMEQGQRFYRLRR